MADNTSFFVNVNPYKGTLSTVEEVVVSSNNHYEKKLETSHSREFNTNDPNSKNKSLLNKGEYCVNLNSYNSISSKYSPEEKFWLTQGKKGIYDNCGTIAYSKIYERAWLLNQVIIKNKGYRQKYKTKYPMISFINISKTNDLSIKFNNKKYFQTLLSEIDNLRKDLFYETNGEIINQYYFENINKKLKLKKNSNISNYEEKFYLSYINETYKINNINRLFKLPKFKEIINTKNNKIVNKIKFLEEINPLLFYYLEKQKNNNYKKNKNIKIPNYKTYVIHELSNLFNS